MYGNTEQGGLLPWYSAATDDNKTTNDSVTNVSTKVASFKVMKKEPDDFLRPNSFLDRYDLTLHSDQSLEQHLQLGDLTSEFSTHSRINTSTNNAAYFAQSEVSSECPSPSYMSSDMPMSDCYLTHSTMERIRKKQERMVKNRHAASLSRMRKKEYLERLEMRYEHMKRENLNLWRQNEEWRARCEHLERSLSDVQTQLQTVEPPPHHQPLKSVSISSPSTRTVAKVAENLTRIPTTQPLSCTRYTTLSDGAKFSRAIPSRTNLSSLSVQDGRKPVYHSSTPSWNRPSETSTISTAGQHSSADTHGVRKTVLNSVFYAGKSSTVISKFARSKLVNLPGIISRHRPGQLQRSKSKLVATTSLLGMVCLISLNMLLPSLSSSSGSMELPHATVNGPPSWHSIPPSSVASHSAGGRVLLNWGETADLKAQSSPAYDALDESNARLSRVQRDTADELNRTLQTNKCANRRHASNHLPNSVKPDCEDETDQNVIDDTSNKSPTKDIPVVSRKLHSRKFIRGQPLSSPTKPASKPHSNGSADYDEHHVSDKRRNSSLLSLLRPNANTRPWTSQRSSSEQNLQLFYRRMFWDPEELIDAAGRRNNTVYLIVPQVDSIYLHPTELSYEQLATHLTLLVPTWLRPNSSAYSTGSRRPINASRAMLQVDCELRNISLLEPPRSRFSQKSHK